MIKTPETHPNHSTIGQYFGYSTFDGVQIYYCDSHDTSCGYWMTNVLKPDDRRNVSERAIGRTFHKAEERYNANMGDAYWYIPAWAHTVYKPKHELDRPVRQDEQSPAREDATEAGADPGNPGVPGEVAEERGQEVAQAAGADLPCVVNKTSTPPVMTEEYRRGVLDACELLRKSKLKPKEISTGVGWANEFPQIKADIIEQTLLHEPS